MTAPYGTIDDKTVMDGFHLFLGKALGQAKAEHLLDEQTLASAESDIMVAGESASTPVPSMDTDSNQQVPHYASTLLLCGPALLRPVFPYPASVSRATPLRSSSTAKPYHRHFEHSSAYG